MIKGRTAETRARGVFKETKIIATNFLYRRPFSRNRSVILITAVNAIMCKDEILALVISQEQYFVQRCRFRSSPHSFAFKDVNIFKNRFTAFLIWWTSKFSHGEFRSQILQLCSHQNELSMGNSYFTSEEGATGVQFTEKQMVKSETL